MTNKKGCRSSFLRPQISQMQDPKLRKSMSCIYSEYYFSNISSEVATLTDFKILKISGMFWDGV